MPKYFIDLGTNLFQGLMEFIPKLRLDDGTWTIYSYEGNRRVYEQSILIRDKLPVQMTVHHYNVAVTDYNGKITFNQQLGAWNTQGTYLSDYTGGANCLAINPQSDPGNQFKFHIVQEEIDCIDICDIIENIVQHDNDAQIYIKCDIEGSEFSVIPRLLSSHLISHVKELHVEWHERFWKNSPEYASKCHNKHSIINRLSQLDIKYCEHH